MTFQRLVSSHLEGVLMNKITLGEGNTPLIKIDDIYFKCEFENPTGSHKDRAFAYQISKLKEQGINRAVISSSGNAAISAANYCKLANIELTVFVSANINKNKLKVLENLNRKIITTPRPISDSVKYAKEQKAYNLRQSTDPNAPIGYGSIAVEIINLGVLPDVIFLPVSSGTALVGIAEGFEKLKHKVSIHAVQTDVVHPIAGFFDKNFQIGSKKSLTDAIVARYTPREDEVIQIIKKTDGWGWVISNQEMEKSRAWLLSHNLDCSYEGAAALAAYWKAKEKGYNFKSIVCILTGKFY